MTVADVMIGKLVSLGAGHAEDVAAWSVGKALDWLREHPKGKIPKRSRKRSGRKKADYETEQREAKLAADWQKAREAGTRKAVFAKDNGMAQEEFDNLLSRVGMRKRRSNKSL